MTMIALAYSSPSNRQMVSPMGWSLVRIADLSGWTKWTFQKSLSRENYRLLSSLVRLGKKEIWTGNSRSNKLM